MFSFLTVYTKAEDLRVKEGLHFEGGREVLTVGRLDTLLRGN